jgi:hypothetical protein
MTAYKLYWVATAKIKPGKWEEATKWWREKGAPDLRSEPWNRSLRTYAGQFALSGEYEIEVWQEIENYAAFDKMDEWYEEDPVRAKKKNDFWQESEEYFEWGPARLVGDWPESSLLPE